MTPIHGWALVWFEQYWFESGDFGVVKMLSKAKNTGVSGMVRAGILKMGTGKMRLFSPDEMPEDWNQKKREEIYSMGDYTPHDTLA